MNKSMMSTAFAVMCACGLASQALAATLPFSTGFEAAQGYANGSQLFANVNWRGDGQDQTGFTVTNSTVGGVGAASGSQWVLVSSPSFTTLGRYQWPVTPVTNFSTLPVMFGSADVRIVAPASGTLDRSTAATISMFDDNADLIGSIALVIDSENRFGFGAGRMAVQMIYRDGTTDEHDLGLANDFSHYYRLALAIDFGTGSIYGSVNGTLLPFVGSTGGVNNLHDFDISTDVLTGAISTGGTYARAGFDNFSIAQIPTPGAAVLLGLAGGAALRRRR